MDSDKFIKFRQESQLLISTSEWLTDQMAKLTQEASNLSEYADPDICEDISSRMDMLLLKAKWEDKAYSEFQKKYKDIAND